MTRRRVVWITLALLVVLAAGLAVGVVALLPRYARQLAVRSLQSLTGRPVTLQALDVSLATGRFSVRGLRIADRDGGLLAELDRLDGRFHPATLLRLHLSIDDLELRGAHVRLVRLAPGRFNVSDLLDRPSSGPRLLDVSIARFTLDGGRLAVEDRVLTPVRTWKTDDIQLQARDVSTRAARGTAFASTTLAGALVTARVEGMQLAPARLRAAINVRDLDLRLAALYLPNPAGLRLVRGTLDAGIGITVDADATSVDADAVITDVAIRRPADTIATASASRLDVLVRELRQRPGAVALRYASVGGDLTVLDPRATPPRPVTFADLTVTVSGIEDAARGTAQIAAHAAVPGGGEVDIGGTAGLTTRRADLRVRARGLELAALARDLPIAGRLAGVGTADLRVVAGDTGRLAVSVTGDLRMDRASVSDGTRVLGTAARVTATGIAYSWPSTLAVEHFSIGQPSVTLERAADGTIGLVELIRPITDADHTAGAAPGESGAPSRPALDVRLGRLEIAGGRAALSDAASGTRVAIDGLTVSARNLTWPGRGVADLSLSASVAGAALSARGTADVARRRVETSLVLGGADLGLLQPWLPIAGRLRGTLARADLRVAASHDGALALTVAGDATVERLALVQSGATPVAVERAQLKGLDYTWPATLRVADLTLTRPAVAVERDAGGTLNLTALAHPAPGSGAPAAEAARPAVDVALARLRIDEGRATLTDAVAGATAEITRIGFTARDVTWPAQGAAEVRLRADVAGGRLTARGEIDPARKQGELAITLRGAELATVQAWLPITGRVRGVVEASLTARIGVAPFTLALRGAVGVADLALLEEARPVLTVGRVDATAIDAQWPASLEIGRLHVRTPWAQIERNPQGELSLRALFRRRMDRPAPVLAEPVAAGPVPGLELTVREALFEDGGVNIVDDAVEPAARFELRGSRLHLRNITWPDRGPASVQLSTPMPGNGTLKASGTFTIEPTRMRLDAELDQVDLAPARPYLPLDARVGGRLTGRVKLTGAFGDTITLTAEGDAALDRLAIGDADRRLATVQRLTLAGFRYQYPTSVRLREVTLQKPWMLVERGSDGSLQVLALLRRRAAATAPPATGPAPAPVAAAGAGSGPSGPARSARVRVGIGTLTMQDGFVRFVDRTTEPDYAEELSSITLTAERIGTNPRRHGTLSLRGTLASGHVLTVQGQVGAVTGPLFFDLTVGVKDFPVPRLNPYLDRLSSWVATRGRLTAALRYKLVGDDLEAGNEVTIEDLELEQGGRGAEVQRRLGVSLGLLTSLLKDRSGTIRLNVPVHGSLSSPEFDYGEAAWAAMRNLAIRLVAAPFGLIGKVFFTEDSRIETVSVDPVTFHTARPAPTPAGAQQIEKLATFLTASPSVRLRVRPVTTVADVAALRREALDARLGGADAPARRQAAVALYAELFPRRQPPADDESLLGELARETAPAPRALRALATDRVGAVREALTRAGVVAERLEPAESRAAVESEGAARVEFEIVR